MIVYIVVFWQNTSVDFILRIKSTKGFLLLKQYWQVFKCKTGLYVAAYMAAIKILFLITI